MIKMLGLVPIPFILILFCLAGNIECAKNNFEIYWNVPTFMCKKYNITALNLKQPFGITQNKNDEFRGDQIAILYDPGNFPAILQYSDKNNTEYFYRNKGVPQEGSLNEHLKAFEQHIKDFIPEENFAGLGIIDFESWRPIYRQNFGILKPYKELSIFLEKKLHPKFTHKQLEQEARKRFEKAGRTFMEETLLLARKLRPYGKWGYYAFPYCFNGRDLSNPEVCAVGVDKENNEISWLFERSDLVLPSVYLNEGIPPPNRLPMVKGRVDEALRVAKMVTNSNKTSKTYIYHRYVYADTHKLIPEHETLEIFNVIKYLKANGVIIWGSSNDLNSRKKCEQFFEYLENTLGPIAKAFTDTYSVYPSKVRD